MTPEDIRAAVAAYYDAISSGDFDRPVAMYAADAVMRDPVGIPAAADHAQRRQRYDGIAAAFASFRIEPSLVLACGNEAAVRWTAHGTAKNGKGVTFEGISTFTFDDAGRIAAMSAYYEPAAILAAMQG